MAGQKQVIKIDDSDSEWEEMPVWLLPQEEILPELLPEQSLPVLLPEQIPPVLLKQTLVIPVDIKGVCICQCCCRRISPQRCCQNRPW